MTKRRYEDRKPWPWWRRRLHAFAIGIQKVFVQPWLDAQGNGSIPAWIAAGVGGAEVYRLVAYPTAPGWPDAFIVFSAFVGVAVYEAAMTVARLNPERLLEIVTSRMGIGDVGGSSSLGWTGPANDGAPGGDL